MIPPFGKNDLCLGRRYEKGREEKRERSSSREERRGEYVCRLRRSKIDGTEIEIEAQRFEEEEEEEEEK